MVASFIFYSCEENNDAVIDPTYYSPLISNPVISQDTVFTTSANPLINFNTSVSVNTNNGSAIRNVICSLTDPEGNLLGNFNMSDNSNSGIYSVTVNDSNISCLLVGNYKLEYIAENNSGLFSNLITSELRVVNTANQPPVISSTNLPDSVVRPVPGDSTLLTISVNVNDPDGLCDLKDVTFVTVRPNGVTLPPIPMFNNQNGQFLFAAYVSFSSDPTSYGYYKYTFTAKDRSNVLSSSVTDSINFIHP